MKKVVLTTIAALAALVQLTAQNPPSPPRNQARPMEPRIVAAPPFSPITVQEGKLQFHAYDNGDMVPDFSFCGYMASDEEIPDLLAQGGVPVVRVRPGGGDDTPAIQKAIDYVGTLPVLTNGFRGVVLLEKGQYRLDGFLTIRTSGVVLRGSGMGEGGTTLFAAGHSRETVIKVFGVNDKKDGEKVNMTAAYVPVNSTVIPLAAGHPFKVGDQVTVTRPQTQEWVHLLGADNIGMSADYQHWLWAGDDFDTVFERKVVAADAGSITVDVPMPMSFDAKYGGGNVSAFTWAGRINHVGIENLNIVSDYDKAYPMDENHRWMAVTFDSAEDCWVRRVEARHFVSSLAAVWETARRVTVEDCKNLEPVGEIGGFRRMAFQTLGQQCLFVRCYSEEGYHDFTVGQNTAGPNAFVLCYAASPHSYSGAVGGWSCGTLFDRVTVESEPIYFRNMYLESMGGSWASANSLCWMCRTPIMYVDNPPLSHNWAWTTSGQSYGDGTHGGQKLSRPDHFYYLQLAARTGKPSVGSDKTIHYDKIFGEDPQKRVYPEEAVEWGHRSAEPALLVDEWIDKMVADYPLASGEGLGEDINAIKIKTKAVAKVHNVIPISFDNGWLAREGRYVSGGTSRSSMWQGMLRRRSFRNPADNINRFVPGREGAGLTDYIDTVVNHLVARGAAGYQHHPALWYERRRDDHGRMQRANPDVWAPFLEQPFARSGQGAAFDRLSKYDLNRWNEFYWDRLDEFAYKAEEKGLFLMSEHYLQHNIIEEGAHWADYPWRAANNINEDIGFAELTYYQADKRVFMAEQFYAVDKNPALARYHRQYIRKNLEALKDRPNVIHHIGIEYTGPLHFMKFWLDCIGEWEKDNAQEVLVALNATKDVQDAILADPHYRALVDMIDIRQWNYGADGQEYAPEGGVNLAPRQYQRILPAVPSTPESIWRQVSDYRKAYPEVAVWNNSGRAMNSNWIGFVAGASLCTLPAVADASFLKNALAMSPLEEMHVKDSQWGMGKASVGYVVYASADKAVLDLSGDKASYRLRWIDPATGAFIGKVQRVRGGSVVELAVPAERGAVAYLYK
ncbi:MAG: pectate lyase [Bacteroidales bacterium]|nr:pectate lyase [Bacteroidales bacterium]